MADIAPRPSTKLHIIGKVLKPGCKLGRSVAHNSIKTIHRALLNRKYETHQAEYLSKGREHSISFHYAFFRMRHQGHQFMFSYCAPTHNPLRRWKSLPLINLDIRGFDDD